VDAAAAAQEMKPAHLALALRIAEQPITAQRTPVLFLSRLAWTLIREGKAAKDQRMLQQAARLLDRALALKPREAERRELAGVLASAGNNKAALQLLAGLEAAGVADLAVRVSLYAADKNFEAAEKAAHQWLELAPDDFEARFQLANVLSWNKQYDEAAQRFQKLAEAKPDDPRLPPRLAEIALWSGQYEIALERYYLLLQPNWRQPELWQGYIDAAAAAKALPADPHKAMLLHIYEKLVQAPSEDAAFLGRFAWTLRRVDEPMKSVALLKRAVELDPKSREMRRQFADALSAAELFDDAEKQYKILLRSAP
jgi:tetratricopeptide (TPR) repeat protein